MKNYFSIDNFRELSILKKIKTVIKNFSATEKTILAVLSVTILISGYIALDDYLSRNFKVTIPIRGGKIVEGEIGSPRFINPLLAISETDRDLVALVYSGLMRRDASGNLILDLADKLDVSDDGLEYTFHISDKAKFHDGEPVTADDVIFTINKAKDPELKSIKRSNWEGVLVDKIDDQTVRFTLNKPYEPFKLNTVLGILPKHLWQDVSSSEFAFSIYNSNPIGSGPYKIYKIARDNVGIPKTYTLMENSDFILGKPFIKYILFKFVKNEDELIALYKEGQIDSIHGINPENAKKLADGGSDIKTTSLSRIFGIFFNQNKATVLASSAVRSALDIATPKQDIVENVLFGFGNVTDSAVPDIFISQSDQNLSSQNLSDDDRITAAQNILEKAGWKKNDAGIYVLKSKDETKILSFSVATSNIKELSDAASTTALAWKKMGADVEVKIYDSSDFNQNIIRQRDYDAVLFGMVVGKVSDLYAFWHSSQRNDPGLNISAYANITADAVLEKIRTLTKDSDIAGDISKLDTEIRKDVPAVFIYTPKFIYTTNRNVQGNEISHLVTADERFSEVYKWYIDTDNVLRILNR